MTALTPRSSMTLRSWDDPYRSLCPGTSPKPTSDWDREWQIVAWLAASMGFTAALVFIGIIWHCYKWTAAV